MVDFNPNNVQLPSSVPAYIATTVRTLLAVGGGYLIAKGVFTAEQLTAIVGGLVPLGVWVWAMIQKHNANKALKAAILAPAGEVK